MPKSTTQEREPVQYQPIMSGDKCVGIAILANLLFNEDFAAEKKGLAYKVPVKARGQNGKCTATVVNGVLTFPPTYGNDDLLKDGEGNQLYVNKDGSLEDWPWSGTDKRSEVKATVYAEDMQATPHTDFSKTIFVDNVTWPDGKFRKIALNLKCNNPVTADEWEQQKTQATQKRQASAVATVADNQDTLARAMFRAWSGKGKDWATIKVLFEASETTIPADIFEAEEAKWLAAHPEPVGAAAGA